MARGGISTPDLMDALGAPAQRKRKAALGARSASRFRLRVGKAVSPPTDPLSSWAMRFFTGIRPAIRPALRWRARKMGACGASLPTPWFRWVLAVVLMNAVLPTHT